jgi:restriction system protein
MGWVSRELATPNQEVEGLIIALEKDRRVADALEVVPNVRFMRYRLGFELVD